MSSMYVAPPAPTAALTAQAQSIVDRIRANGDAYDAGQMTSTDHRAANGVLWDEARDGGDAMDAEVCRILRTT